MRRNFSQTGVGRRLQRLTAGVVTCAAAASAALVLWHAARDRRPALETVPAPLVDPGAMAPAAGAGRSTAGVTPATAAALDPAPARQAGVASTIRIIVGRNDTLDVIFKRLALDNADLQAIRNLPGIRQSLDFLKPGDAITLTRSNDGAVEALSRKVSETQTLNVVRGATGFAAQIVEDPVQTRLRTASASIDSSLFQAAESASMSDAVALKIAAVFAWDIDFVLDIRAGDHFKVVYQQIYQHGRYLRDGELLAAEFVNAGRVYRAVRFVGDDGSSGYYSPDGHPLRKAFLRAPVDFTRVSSGFNPARLHPILNRIRGHMGTDYAAPVGTPVHAAGDGRVSFEGVRGGYGNALVLLHGGGVSTLYGHLSRFARGLKSGAHVNQGDVIGYVGMTGLATGPHLHYEYLVDGVHRNPQTVRLPGARPLQGAVLDRFRSGAAPLLSDLAAPRSPADGVLESVGGSVAMAAAREPGAAAASRSAGAAN